MKTSVTVAIGPELPEFGSWNWIGVSLCEALASVFEIHTFSNMSQIPACDIVVFLKFLPTYETLLALLKSGRRLVFVPVDIFGSLKEIDAHRPFLKEFDLIILHSRRLLRYFEFSRRCVFLDHPLKYFISPELRSPAPRTLLWVGRRCNIAPIVSWANRHITEFELWVLTNLEETSGTATELGFSRPDKIRLCAWTPERHNDWVTGAAIAIDIKADDFRSRHKPPAKAFDYVASGIPVITNRGSSTALELAHRGWDYMLADQALPANGSIDACSLLKNSDAVRQAVSPERIGEKLRAVFFECFADSPVLPLE